MMLLLFLMSYFLASFRAMCWVTLLEEFSPSLSKMMTLDLELLSLSTCTEETIASMRAVLLPSVPMRSVLTKVVCASLSKLSGEAMLLCVPKTTKPMRSFLRFCMKPVTTSLTASRRVCL